MFPSRHRLPAPFHHPSWMARPRRILGKLAARRKWSTWTGRRSSSSATRTAREHRHVIARSPAPTFHATHPACAGLGEALRTRLGPRPSRRPSAPGDPQLCHRCTPCGLLATVPPVASRGFTSQGPDDSRRPAPRHHRHKSRRTSFAPTRSARTPLVTRPLRQRKENPPPSTAPPKLSSACSAIPPHRPILTNKRRDVGLRGLRTARFREAGVPNKTCVNRLRSSRCLSGPAAPDCFHSLTPPGPRAASPEPPRRSPRSAAPEVPSIDGLPFSAPRLSPGSTFQVGRSPQLVANLWKTHGTALKLLRTPTALTYRGRRNLRLRSSGTESQPLTRRTGR